MHALSERLANEAAGVFTFWNCANNNRHCEVRSPLRSFGTGLVNIWRVYTFLHICTSIAARYGGAFGDKLVPGITRCSGQGTIPKLCTNTSDGSNYHTTSAMVGHLDHIFVAGASLYSPDLCCDVLINGILFS